MELIKKHQQLIDEYEGKIKIVYDKWKAQREKLQKELVETAREQAIEILENDNINTMGNPENLYKKVREMKLGYNGIVVKQGEEINTIVKEYYTKILKDVNVAAILDCKGIGMKGMLQMYLLEKVKQWNDSRIKCPNGKTYKECYNNFQDHAMVFNNFDWEKHIKLVNPNILNM